MEGILTKYDGFLSGWKPYFFILYEDTLNYMDEKKQKLQGSIHLKIAKVSSSQTDPLLLKIFNGTSEMELKARTIKEKVEWMNAIVQH